MPCSDVHSTKAMSLPTVQHSIPDIDDQSLKGPCHKKHPLPKDSPLKDDLPDEPVYSVETSLSNASWDMYFDGAIRANEKGKLISGIGILFVSPDKYMSLHAFSLLEPCSNNAAKYQALIIGLELALEFGITMLEAFGTN
ncbi:hypothetical protein AAC387_Pa05g1050 [Persea americana]